MIKKILFLLTFLLTTLGGGNLAWAESVTFNTTSGNLNTPQDDISLIYSGANLASNQLKVTKGGTFTISTSSRFIQSIEITLLEKTNASQYVTANVGSTAYDDTDDTNIKYTWTGIAKSIVFTNANDEDARDFRIVSVKVTYTTTDPSLVNDETVQTYPYTWDFTSSSSLWTSSIEQLAVFTNTWDHITVESKDEYRPKVEHSNWGYNIDIIKGLRFTTPDAGSLCLDWKNHALWMNGTVTIPNLTVGQTITFNSSVNVTGDAAVVSTTENTFTVETAGPATFTVNFGHIWSIQVNKASQTLSFAKPEKTINFGEDAPTNALNRSVGDGDITYSSSNDHVATVDASTGALHILNAGTCYITATAAETDTYAETSTSYMLTVNATSTPTLVWSSIHGETNPAVTSTVAYGNHFNCYCTNSGHATVQYRSDNPEIATVAIQDGHAGGTSYKYCQITPVNVGSVTITAFVPSYHGEAEQSISFTLTVTKGDIVGKLYFSPSSGTVQEGYTIGPRLKFPTMLAADIEELTAVSSDGSKATVALEMNDTYLSYQNEKVDGVYPIVRGVNEGHATITVTFKSKKYESATATYTVTVVGSGSQSWNWKEPGKEYKLYTEDFMKIPDIEGNTTGNFQLSVGSYNVENSGYIYDIKKGAITYNNKDWHRGEGVPNYTIVTDGITNPGAAKIFWCKGGDNDGAALFVFAQSAGDVKLRATDTQTGEYNDLTIHILNKTSYGTYTDPTANGKFGATYGSNVHTDWSQNATTPFTWDFTTNFTVSDDTNCYWIDNGGGTYSLGYPTSFNYDWADTDNNGKTAGSGSNGNEESKFKAIHLKQMEGMTIYLANNDGNWHNKENKVRILAAGTDAQGKPKGRLNINGGTFKLTVPNIPKTALASTYKVFVKAVSDGSNPLVNIVVNGTENKNTPTTTPGIFSADVTTGQKVELWLNNVTIYWIALSTEANYTAMPNDNKTLTYAATSYSYGKALDLAKSEEVNNGLTAYYAKSFTNGKDAASAVTLRQVTLDKKRVRANTGLVLTSETPLTNYMIADAENENMYSVPEPLSENYLVAGDGTVVNSTTDSGEGIKTNFALSYAYKKFADDGTTAMTGYQYNRDWSFYKVMPSATVPKGKAYLQVPGNLRVKSDGTIEEVTPAGSRRAADGSDDDRPANKLMLDIVYEDEAHGFDATTAINDVKTDTVTVDDDAWYTIQGVRVNTPARGGIYIHNGRKVVIK